jgi:acyl carrier protein
MNTRSQTINGQKLYAIVASLFGLRAEDVNDTTSQDTVEQWDSMGTVTLISELEGAFDVEFDLMELVAFRSVGEIRNVLASRGVQF